MPNFRQKGDVDVHHHSSLKCRKLYECQYILKCGCVLKYLCPIFVPKYLIFMQNFSLKGEVDVHHHSSLKCRKLYECQYILKCGCALYQNQNLSFRQTQPKDETSSSKAAQSPKIRSNSRLAALAIATKGRNTAHWEMRLQISFTNFTCRWRHM